MTTITRTERDGFTYVSNCTYATDPATVADVKVGDVVRVTDTRSPAWCRRPVFETVVENVGRDEFGVYINCGLYDYANTIINGVEIIERAP